MANSVVSENKKKSLSVKTWNTIFLTVMLIIPVIHWLVFWLYVNIDSIFLSFKLPTGKYSLETLKSAWRSLTSVSDISIGVKNTLIYFVKDLIMIPFQLLIAYFMYRKLKGTAAFRIIFYLPGIVSGVAISQMFKEFISTEGPIGVILSNLGVDPIPDILGNSDYATWTILFYTVYLGWAGNMLLFGGALARVPLEVIESGRLDGINTWTEFWQIIIPLVWSTMSTVIILQICGIFGCGGPILLFTYGQYDTYTIGFWIFKRTLEGPGAYNEIAATGLILTVIGVPIIMLLKWLIEKIPTVEY